MAGQSGVPPGLVEEFEQALAAQQINVAMLALTVFDFVLCFPREVDLLWRQKLRLGSWLYFFTRYGFMAFSFMDVLITSETPDCDAWVIAASAIDLISAVSGAGFAMLRAWALYDRKMWVIVFYLALYIPWFGMSMKILTTTTCTPATDAFASLTQLLLAFMNAISLILNCFIVILTVNKTYVAVRNLHPDILAGSNKQTLLSLLLYDGSIYFAIMFVNNIMTIIFAYRAPGPLQSIGGNVGAVLAVNFVCRFILDLREAIDPFNAHIITIRSPPNAYDGTLTSPVIHISHLSPYEFDPKKGGFIGNGDDMDGRAMWVEDLAAFPDYGASLMRMGAARQGEGLGKVGVSPGYGFPTQGWSPDREKALPALPIPSPAAPAHVTVQLRLPVPGRRFNDDDRASEWSDRASYNSSSRRSTDSV